MLAKMHAKEFLEKYGGRNGRVDLNETGLKFNALDPNSAFVRDLGGLSDVDFFAVSEKLSREASLAYLYNKYPDFFSKWDRGRKLTHRLTEGALDGRINDLELSASGGLEKLVEEVKTALEPKDRFLLKQSSWIMDLDIKRKFSESLNIEQSQLVPGVHQSIYKAGPQNAEEFIKKYQFYWRSGSRSGRGHVRGFSIDGGNPNNVFVKELSALPDLEFDRVTSEMTPEALKIYLYNKHAVFFRRWDNGYILGSKSGRQTLMPSRRLDGWIANLEVEYAGGILQFYNEVLTDITDQRDLFLLRTVRLLDDPRWDLELKQTISHVAHARNFRAFCSDLMPGNFSNEVKAEGCVHSFEKSMKEHTVFCRMSFSTDGAARHLETQVKVVQKFWLRMVPQEQTTVSSDLQVGIEWLDARYVIHSNYPEIAQSFLSNAEVLPALQALNEVCPRLEIHRGLLSMTIREPELSGLAPRDLPRMVEALLVLARIYEAGSLVKVTMLPLFSVCPYCRDAFQDSASSISCPQCSTMLHRMCWQENGQCTTWGCTSTTSAAQ